MIIHERTIRVTMGEGKKAEVWEGTFAEFMAGNEDSPDLIQAVGRMLRDGSEAIHGGGGAADVYTVEAIEEKGG